MEKRNRTCRAQLLTTYFRTGLLSLLKVATNCLRLILQECAIDLVTVFDAISTSRQTREKLQCLYENNFLRTAVLKKNMICKLKLHS